MTAFNPTKDYHNDWAFVAFVEDVSWERKDADGNTVTTTGLKAKFGDFDTPELAALAANLSLTNEGAAVVLWEPKPEDVDVEDWEPIFAPADAHVLIRTEHANERWLIIRHTQSRFGHWLLACEKEVLNADS